METALKTRDYQGLRALLSDDFTDHSAPPGTAPGADGYVEVMRYVTEALGISYHLDDFISLRRPRGGPATAHGVHHPDAFRVSCHGRHFAMATMHWYRPEGSRLAEHWGVLDQLGMLAQVGALPSAP